MSTLLSFLKADIEGIAIDTGRVCSRLSDAWQFGKCFSFLLLNFIDENW